MNHVGLAFPSPLGEGANYRVASLCYLLSALCSPLYFAESTSPKCTSPLTALISIDPLPRPSFPVIVSDSWFRVPLSLSLGRGR